MCECVYVCVCVSVFMSVCVVCGGFDDCICGCAWFKMYSVSSVDLTMIIFLLMYDLIFYSKEQKHLNFFQYRLFLELEEKSSD